MCPITSKPKGYPFEVNIPKNLPIEGVILSDQIKSLDWQSRYAEFICELPEDSLADVITKLQLLIEL